MWGHVYGKCRIGWGGGGGGMWGMALKGPKSYTRQTFRRPACPASSAAASGAVESTDAVLNMPAKELAMVSWQYRWQLDKATFAGKHQED